jgi:hypothetical protein
MIRQRGFCLQRRVAESPGQNFNNALNFLGVAAFAPVLKKVKSRPTLSC